MIILTNVFFPEIMNRTPARATVVPLAFSLSYCIVVRAVKTDLKYLGVLGFLKS